MCSPVVSTVLARPARRSLSEILRATSSKSFSCTRGNTAAFNGATAGLNLHIAAPHPKSACHAGAGLNLPHHLMTEMQLGVMQPGHTCMYLHDAIPWLVFQRHATLAVLRLSCRSGWRNCTSQSRGHLVGSCVRLAWTKVKASEF